MKLPLSLFVALLCCIAGLAACVGPSATFHFLSPDTTGESERLMSLLSVGEGGAFAEIGAGDGRLARSMASRAHAGTTLFVTELDPERLMQLRERKAPNMVVVGATESELGLPQRCCEAIYLRNVYHHIADPASFNRQLREALRDDGKVAVIDFAPGAFWFMRKSPPGTSKRRTGHGVAIDDLMTEMATAGFKATHIEPNWGGWMYLVLLEPAAPKSGP